MINKTYPVTLIEQGFIEQERAPCGGEQFIDMVQLVQVLIFNYVDRAASNFLHLVGI